MGRIVGGAQRAKEDAAAKAAHEARRAYDLEYGLPGWDPTPPPPRPMRFGRYIDRRVSSGHKVGYRLEFIDG